ncbi:MAG: nitrogen fixation protein NifQ [Azonexaceae bacterium]|uniref:nitrogen fixation protein NifQ n=1 Tax=Azonexus sp. R2A61 TaxID=2744443 RepID=UPI001F21A62F|nr:nitrogen fixation protein NifQ [Azonexus sp. R2A61]MCE1240206.1 nitrogen fixation protein NifQ [Azonexaceae bacterium]
MNGPDRLPYRMLLQTELLAAPAAGAAARDPNRPLLASLIAGQAAGYGCLPAHLGLGEQRHTELMHHLFPGCLPDFAPTAAVDLPESEELQRLLTDHRAHEFASETWMIDILVAACAGKDHLWQDLGLNGRDELSRLMWINFPALARANTGDMKWKKFLYRQFCAREGIYVCPAPSCGVCADHAKCFGPEN